VTTTMDAPLADVHRHLDGFPGMDDARVAQVIAYGHAAAFAR